MTPTRLHWALVLAFALAPPPRVAWAEWSTSPNAPGVAVAVETSDQDGATAVPDGSGGTIVAWRDLRNTTDYFPYLQRLDARGVEQWTHSGILVPVMMNTWATGAEYVPALAADGAGAVLAFGTNFDLGARAQAFGLAGTPRWGGSSVGVDNLLDHRDVAVRTDAAGNSVVAWRTLQSGAANGLYLQKLGPNGARLWTSNGIKLESGTVSHFGLAGDGAGGWIVAWSLGSVVRAQRIDAGGSLLWGSGGIIVSNAGGGSAGHVEVAASAPGEVIVVWEDFRSNVAYDLYAQRIDAAGTLRWFANGNAICTAPNAQRLRRDLESREQLVPDGSGGVYVTWRDLRVANDGSYTVYAQHVSSSGTATWAIDGIALAPGTTYATPVAVPDGEGGVIVVWGDQRDAGGPLSGVYAQRLSANGTAAWSAGGQPVRIGGIAWPNTAVATDGGGAVVYWNEIFFSADLWAGRIDGYGIVGTVDPAITGVTDVPGDQGGFVRLDWNRTSLDAGPSNPITTYFLWREVPQALARARLESGTAVVEGGTEATTDRPTLLAATFAGVTSYWEHVGSIAATGAATYTAVVATTADSLPDSNPTTAFLVSAVSTAPTRRWNSRPASGYSVDNLAPAKPAPFTGQFTAGTATLHWNPNDEVDLAGYRLYRGTNATFVPGPGNRIASPPDTGYVDVAGGSFVYKLTAIDVHGNESPANVLAPGGVVGAGGAAANLAFAPPVPNPATGTAAMLRFTLPRPMHARIALYTPAGRAVSLLARVPYDGGDHAVALPLQDARGARLPAGVYLVRLETDDGAIDRKLVLLR
jgi:hypothetical protein